MLRKNEPADGSGRFRAGGGDRGWMDIASGIALPDARPRQARQRTAWQGCINGRSEMMATRNDSYEIFFDERLKPSNV